MWKKFVLLSSAFLPTISSAQTTAKIRVTEETRLRSFQILADSGRTIHADHTDPDSIELPGPIDADRSICGDLEVRTSPFYDTPWEKQQKLERKLGRITWRLLELSEPGSLNSEEEEIIQKTPRCWPFSWDLNRIREALAGKNYGRGITQIAFSGGRDSKAKLTLNGAKISFRAKNRIRFDSHKNPLNIHKNAFKSRDGKAMKISRTKVKTNGRAGQKRQQECSEWYSEYWVCGPFEEVHTQQPIFDDECEQKMGNVEGKQWVRVLKPGRTEFYQAAIKDTSVMTRFTFKTVRPAAVKELSECEH